MAELKLLPTSKLKQTHTTPSPRASEAESAAGGRGGGCAIQRCVVAARDSVIAGRVGNGNHRDGRAGNFLTGGKGDDSLVADFQAGFAGGAEPCANRKSRLALGVEVLLLTGTVRS